MPVHRYPILYECNLVRKDGIVIDSVEEICENITEVRRKLRRRFFPRNEEKWEIIKKKRLTAKEMPKWWRLEK
jgi:hypothetical protein